MCLVFNELYLIKLAFDAHHRIVKDNVQGPFPGS